ncbi:uracil-DNA glycosylase [Marinicella gelatinilytica]|uniref:uracil-DNA glycosylase n=1 Tax=Marinicella gelatinilytica TaxID=2996017 RepID=UPI002260A2B5|nr:uracil-DNA glycosylase [Marinicella gelatinilytica]MCX7545794.1 uracil-DNA glycosylase [Marinicella gelatinilytica]
MVCIKKFVNDLACRGYRPQTHNPYKNPDLAANLYQYLITVKHHNSRPVLLVGEALGFKGGRLTGIPFSCGDIYSRFNHPLLLELKSKLILTSQESENTATMVWEYLTEKQQTPLFWNAFPFHPYQVRRPKTNRAPTVNEIQQGSRYLQQLADIFQPTTIAGIGRKGQLAAQKAFPNHAIQRIRHPSFGGKREFISGMDGLFSDLKSI